MTPDSPDRLADLRRRWEAEPGSRLFLQLAEEYRRADRHAEAAQVLEKGLAQQPNHVSAHVALGRVRLEMGEPGGAAKALERAIELDVTNLVANKLLVEAYLGRGEREKARQRLDLYRLLNDSDPDLADLRRRIDGGRAAAPPAPEAAAPPTAAPAVAQGRSWGGEATADSLEPPPSFADTAREEEPMTTRTGQDETWEREEPSPDAGATPAAASAEPFGDLAAGDATHRYLQGLAGEGLFPLPASPPTAEAPPETLPEPRPAEVEALAESASEDAAAPPAATPPAPAPTAPRSEPERPTVTLGQLYLDQGHFAQARRVFAAVLDEEPDHAVARRGLERAERELAAAGPEPVTAAELLRDAEPGQPARRAVLGAYLARILRSRESRPSDVPR
ncbi:MAG TPA: tetratricopeptide repeat protein [Thermoanaerobaculia bacterium]